ncbi:MAG: PQQ-binding-like beta-propeller repeat protein [Gemmataceae bacterium]
MIRWLFVFVAVVLVGPVRADNWPGWRGPKGTGHCAEQNIPVRWDRQKNVQWKIELPNGGNSSPVVWGDRIFLTQALDKKAHKRALLCLARKDGKLFWKRVVNYKETEPTHNTNPLCSASPITDGERVVVSFGSAGLYCYDFEGKQLWNVELGKLHHIWGTASSPILYKNLVILWCGPGDRQFLVAVDKRTGKQVWKYNEPGGARNRNAAGKWVGSWSTPVIANVQGRDELLLSVPYKLKSFDPNTGKVLWHCDGLGPLVYTSPVCSQDGIVVALSGYGGPAMAVQAGGKGDVTKTHRLWRHSRKKNPQRIGTGVIVGDNYYLLSTPGVAQCFDLKSGKDLWQQKRLSEAQSWSSMVYADGRFYVVNTKGTCYVLKASPKYEVLAQNSINEVVRGSIAISNGDLFIRSYKHLWRIRDQR